MFIDKDDKVHTHTLTVSTIYAIIMCNIYLLGFTGKLDLKKKFNVAFWLSFSKITVTLNI